MKIISIYINLEIFFIDLGVRQQFEIISESKRSSLNVSKSNISTLRASSSAQINVDFKSKENLSTIAGKTFFLYILDDCSCTLSHKKLKSIFKENYLKKEIEGKILIKDPEKEKVAQVLKKNLKFKQQEFK